LAHGEVTDCDVDAPSLVLMEQFRKHLTHKIGAYDALQLERLATQAREGEQIID
jgi:hypothetical protein